MMRWDLASDLEEEPEKWRSHMADLDAHKPFRDFRYRATSWDGSEVYIATSGKPLFDPQGRFVGYRGVGSDITAAVRAGQLEEALQEAKVVGDNIAHDLRTPLTRARIRLERGREHASTLEELRQPPRPQRLDRLGDVRVLPGRELRGSFDNRYLAAEAPESLRAGPAIAAFPGKLFAGSP